MTLRLSAPALAAALLLAGTAGAAERLSITASHPLEIARPGEIIAIPWTQVSGTPCR